MPKPKLSYLLPLIAQIPSHGALLTVMFVYVFVCVCVCVGMYVD